MIAISVSQVSPSPETSVKRLARLSLIPAIVSVFACDDSVKGPADSTSSTVKSATLHVPATLGDLSARGLGRPIGKSAPRVEGVVATGVAEAPPFEAREALAQQARRRQASQPSVASAMIIRNGAVTIEVDSIEAAVERVRQLALSLGGYVGGMTMSTGAYQVRSATLELRVPANRFDTVMTGMPAFGKVEQSSTSSDDVGEEFVDIEARTANAKRLEARLVQILATKTGKLSDVLAVERELARVREEIERHEGRIRYLSTHVATSTITARLHEKAPLIAAQPGQNVFAKAFLNMWRNFIGVLTAGIEMLGVLIPIAVVLGVAYLVWRRWLRRPISPSVQV